MIFDNTSSSGTGVRFLMMSAMPQPQAQVHLEQIALGRALLGEKCKIGHVLIDSATGFLIEGTDILGEHEVFTIVWPGNVKMTDSVRLDWESKIRGICGQAVAYLKAQQRAAAANPWASLGFPGPVGRGEAEAAFRKLAKEHHPDLNPGKPDDEFKNLNAAWDQIRKMKGWE